MARIDIDAARRAKQETETAPEPNVLFLGGREFELVATAPAAFLVGLGRVQKGDLSGLEDALASLFVKREEVAEALKLGLDLEDLEPITLGIYGIPLGEASASG